MARKQKEPDITKPFKDPINEKMALLRSEGFDKTASYEQCFPNVTHDSARALSSKYIESHYIDKRALQLLASQGLSEERLASRLNDLVDSKNDATALGAVSKGFDLIGYGKDSKQADATYNPVQIIIERCTINQPDVKHD